MNITLLERNEYHIIHKNLYTHKYRHIQIYNKKNIKHTQYKCNTFTDAKMIKYCKNITEIMFKN